MDLNYKPNNAIFELFNIHYDLTRSFFLNFVQNNSAVKNDINDTLLSTGYHGPLPMTNLDEVFMKSYSYNGQTYLLENTLVKSKGDFGLVPAELKKQKT